jgi:hypothetical protein
MKTVEINIDAFYDMVSEIDDDEYENSIVFDSKDGRIFIAGSSPGRFLYACNEAVPAFRDGKYIGVGSIDGRTIELDNDMTALISPMHKPKLDDMGVVARIKLAGNPEEWRIVDDPS